MAISTRVPARMMVIGVLAVAAFTVGTVALVRARRTDDRPRGLNCDALMVNTAEQEKERSALRSSRPQDVRPGERLLAVDPWNPAIHWTFSQVTQRDPFEGRDIWEKREGAFKPGSEQEMTITQVDPKTGAQVNDYLFRHVVAGSKIWMQTEDGLGWVECERPPRGLARNPTDMDMSIYQRQLSPPPYTKPPRNVPDAVAVNIGPGLLHVYADPSATDANNGLITYRQVPWYGYEWLDIRVTIDQENHLRKIEVADSERPFTYQSTTIDPAPDHPPITGPTGQPIRTAPR